MKVSRYVLVALIAAMLVANASAAGVLIRAQSPAAGLNDAAYFQYRAGNVEGARQLYLDAIALDPSYERARSNLATLSFGEGDYGTAIAQLEELVALDPSSPNYRYDLAVNCIARLRSSQAPSAEDFWCGLDNYETAESLSPGFAHAAENIAVLRGFLA